MTVRAPQALLIASTFASCWLGLQVVHECGHVLAATAGGETVRKVVLHPLAISRTDASLDRHPLLVLGGGPIVGSLLPMIVMAVMKALRSRLFFLFRFFAGFCLIANGAYLGVDSFEGVGDAGDLIRLGAPRWMLILFGLATVPAGLRLWNGLGPSFGWGPAQGKVDGTAVRFAAGLVLVLVAIGISTGR